MGVNLIEDFKVLRPLLVKLMHKPKITSDLLTDHSETNLMSGHMTL